jgi:dolichyl-phosphate beta-glucosyltransferase
VPKGPGACRTTRNPRGLKRLSPDAYREPATNVVKFNVHQMSGHRPRVADGSRASAHLSAGYIRGTCACTTLHFGFPNFCFQLYSSDATIRRMKLSVIVPVYNEEIRLRGSLSELLRFATDHPAVCELLFVDDGSTDGTRSVLDEGVSSCPCAKTISYSENRGKGGAIREGVMAAQGDVVMFMDVDLSTPLSYVDSLLEPFADTSCQVVIGSRRVAGAEIVGHQHWARELMGRVFTWLSRRLVPGVMDFTCGMKAFRADAARTLFSAGRVDDWSFDSEILYLAHKAGCPIIQVPVSWHDVAGSKVRVFRNAIVSLYQLMALPIRYYFSGQRELLAEGAL